MNQDLWCASSWGGADSRVARRSRDWVRGTADELGDETNVIEAGTLVTERAAKSSLEHDLDPSVGLVVRFWDGHGDMVNLIEEVGVESDVSWCRLTTDAEVDTLSGGRSSILVLAPIEPSEVDAFAVDDNAKVFVFGCIPAIDLVEVEREFNRLGVTWDVTVCFVWVLWVSIILPVSSEELGEDRSASDPSVGPSLEGSVFKVFIDNLP